MGPLFNDVCNDSWGMLTKVNGKVIKKDNSDQVMEESYYSSCILMKV